MNAAATVVFVWILATLHLQALASPADKGRQKSPVSGHIVGGSLAPRGTLPYVAYFTSEQNVLWGGSLIASQWVLTAAQGVKGYTKFTVRLGVYNRTLWAEDGRVTVETSTFFVHSSYDATNKLNDVALLKLLMPVPVTAYIGYVRLPKNSQASTSFTGTVSTGAGWGRTNDTSGLSPELRQVSLSVINNSPDCTSVWGTTRITAVSLCTGTTGTNTVCSGDYGGPLTYKETDNLWTQLGISSYTTTCSLGQPAVFARVSQFLTWISNLTGITIRP